MLQGVPHRSALRMHKWRASSRRLYSLNNRSVKRRSQFEAQSLVGARNRIMGWQANRMHTHSCTSLQDSNSLSTRDSVSMPQEPAARLMQLKTGIFRYPMRLCRSFFTRRASPQNRRSSLILTRALTKCLARAKVKVQERKNFLPWLRIFSRYLRYLIFYS